MIVIIIGIIIGVILGNITKRYMKRNGIFPDDEDIEWSVPVKECENPKDPVLITDRENHVWYIQYLNEYGAKKHMKVETFVELYPGMSFEINWSLLNEYQINKLNELGIKYSNKDK